jgi:hypothetical protein
MGNGALDKGVGPKSNQMPVPDHRRQACKTGRRNRAIIGGGSRGPDRVSQPASIRLGSNMLRLRGRECCVPVNLSGVDAKAPELDLNEKTLLY